MTTLIQIEVDDLVIDAELGDTDCARAIAEMLPIESTVNTWGEEIYFAIGLGQGTDETATRSFQFGEMAYGPSSDAICLFFGPTPVSGPNESAPANPCNRIGKMTGDWKALKQVSYGATIRVKKND